MSVFLRRSAYALSKTPIAASLGRAGSVRMYSLGQQSHQTFGHHSEVELGDLVTYTDASGGKSAGYIQKIFEESGAQGNKGQLAEIQNYHTKKVAYTDLKNVQSVARKHDSPQSASTTSQSATKATTNQQATAQQARPTPQQPATQQARPTTQQAQQTHQGSKGTMTSNDASSAKANIAQTHAKESAQKLEQQLNSETSPLNTDFAPGDIVRFRVGQNYTAGVVLELIYNTVHDEHGNFHGATKENPMAKLENLWTKKIHYHHLNVLEHVKRARDVTPGRFAEQEFAVYEGDKQAKK
eukprot:Phypoly_transcript_06742.p1 GENE.Phypoly_transcript_06742~~Phypoly_transcript_06742.p1  ORF type:complete len:297 (-),score=57.84 Phypoly_transcript_06742:759-1649(-)